MRRGGVRVLRLPASCTAGIDELIVALEPDMMIVCGAWAPAPVVVRWLAVAHASPRPIAVAAFRPAAETQLLTDNGLRLLAPDPIVATRAALDALAEPIPTKRSARARRAGLRLLAPDPIVATRAALDALAEPIPTKRSARARRLRVVAA
jgi:hypothetical protein